MGSKALSVVACLFVQSSHAQESSRGGFAPLGYEFTYQGNLSDMGGPAEGLYDMQFGIFTDTGDQIGSLVSISNVPVSDGGFSVELAFEEELWIDTPGLEKHLEVRVRSAGGGAYTTLSPRTKLTAAPHANVAHRLLFPYNDVGFGPDFLVPMLGLTRASDGPAVQFRTAVPSDRPVALIQGDQIYNYDQGLFNGALQVDAPSDKVGILAFGDTISVLGVLRSGLVKDSENRSAVVGQVGFDSDPNYSALAAQNVAANTYALFARGSLSGEFFGDVLARDDFRVLGELSEDYLAPGGVSEPSRAAPLAYGLVSTFGNATNQTANFSSVWETTNSRYFISIMGASSGTGTSHTVVVTPRSTNTPIAATYDVSGGGFTVTIWNLLTNTKTQAPFSIIIYDAEPSSIVDVPTESPEALSGDRPAGVIDID